MRKLWLAAPAVLALAAAAPNIVQADPIHTDPTVALGSDYFQTQPGASFNFGGPIGVVNFQGLPIGPGLTDTIVQRKADAMINGPSIPLQIVDLSLKSSAPVNVGGSFFDVFVTLDPANLGNDTGNMMIHGTLAGGTFDSSLNIFFDAHFAPTGGGSSFDVFNQVILSQSGGLWGPTPPAGAVIVMGPDDATALAGSLADQQANLHTGLDPMEVDFFPGLVNECDPNGHGCHPVMPAPVPEPETIFLLGAALIAQAWVRRRIVQR